MSQRWNEIELQYLLKYEQPTNYIVKSTAYSDNYKTPVLTPGKSFIKGYTNETEGIFKKLPAIIFDDFTTSSKFVNFPFKVKSSAMKILIPTSELVNLKFVFYSMQILKVRSDTHKRYWISVFSKKKISFPPLPEQRAIVSKIEQLFSELDNGVSNLKQAKSRLEVYKQAILKKAFEGDLSKLWRKNQGKLPTTDELIDTVKSQLNLQYQSDFTEWEKSVETWKKKGKKGKKPTKPKKVTFKENNETNKILNLPGSWKEINLEYVAKAIDPQPSHRTPPEKKGGIPYVSIKDIDKVTGQINFNGARKVSETVLEEHIERYNINSGDFVIGKIGTIGKPFHIPQKRNYALSANVVLVQPLKELVNPKFLFYLNISPLIEKQFKKGAKATTQAAFGIKKVRLLRIPLAPIQEQNFIVNQIESSLSVCDKTLKDIEENLKKTEALRQSILKKAFSGKLLTNSELVACKKAADWEPAEKLIQKIKDAKSTKKVAS